MWDLPLTAGTLDSLYYRVIVANNDTGVVIVSNTTTKTSYALQNVQPCQYYTANVTAFSSEYHGGSVVTGGRSPGGMCVRACVQDWCLYAKMILFRFTIHLEYYHVSSMSQNVGFVMSSTVVVFSIGLHLKV